MDESQHPMPDQPMFGMDDISVFDPTVTQAIQADPINTAHNEDLDKILSTGNTSSFGNPGSAVFTPGTLGLINNLWTPSDQSHFASTDYSPPDQIDYFHTAAPSTTSVNLPSTTLLTTQQSGPVRSRQQSQPSQRTKESSTANAPGSPMKKQRRQRKKKVRTEEEQKRNRENFLERNRKAAQKCRQRKKVWMDEVQQKKDAASELMNILGVEVIQLVDEVKRLRMLVEAHRGCEHGHMELRKNVDISSPVSTGNSAESGDSEGAQRRRMSETTINSIEDGSSTESATLSLIEGWKEYSDPCWKLAKEAFRRFSEINPGSHPTLPREAFFVQEDDVGTASRGSSVVSTDDHAEPSSRHSSVEQFADQRIGQEISKITTFNAPELSYEMPASQKKPCTTPGMMMPNLRVPRSEISDLQKSASYLSPCVVGMEDLKIPNLVSVS